MNWPLSTHIQIEVTANRGEFTVAPVEFRKILDAIDVRKITFKHFSRLTFQPKTLAVADPGQLNWETDSFPETAWTPLAPSGEVTYSAKFPKEPALVILEPTEQAASIVGTLDSLYVNGNTDVILELGGSRNQNGAHPNQPSGFQTGTLTVRIYGAGARAIFLPKGPLDLIANDTILAGVENAPFSEAEELTYRAGGGNQGSKIEVMGESDRLVIKMKVGSRTVTQLFEQGEVPISAISFSKLVGGERVSSLVGESSIAYPGLSYPKVTIQPKEVLKLDKFSRFAIRSLQLNKMPTGLHFSLEGEAGRIQAGSRAFPTDHRRTLFDKVWYHPDIQKLFEVKEKVKG